MDKINTLVLEGGGMYGIAYIGALKELQSKLDFSKIFLWHVSRFIDIVCFRFRTQSRTD